MRQHRSTIHTKKIFELKDKPASEVMKKAIDYFERIKSDSCLFGLAKCKLKYAKIVLKEEGQNISQETKDSLMEILIKAEQTFSKQEHWMQSMICKIVQSKVKIAGTHTQADRDEANLIIDAARGVFNK
jgi:hypothetical protein